MSDFLIGSTFDLKFTTRRFSTGVPFALVGGSVVAYVDNTGTPISAGITLTPDFNGVTGLNNIRIVATVANGYAQRSSYFLVISAGTVDSVSVVGEVVAEFTIQRDSAARTRIVDSGIAQAVAATTITLATTAPATANALDNDYVLITDSDNAAHGQTRRISGYTAGRVCTVGAWTPTPTNPRYAVLPMGTVILGAATHANAVIPNVTTVGGVTNNVGGSVGSVVGAVGSVTGNVGGSVVGNVNGDVDGNVVGGIGFLSTQAKADVNAEADTAILDAALATAADLSTANAALVAIQAITDNLPNSGSLSDISTAITAIKAITDQLVFTVTNQVDANVQSINEVNIVGDGSVTPFNV